MAMPGNAASHQAMRMSLAPCVNMVPQVGISGGTPTPRKDRDASMMMANPSVMVPSTIYEATTLGRIVAQHMRAEPAPMALAASV